MRNDEVFNDKVRNYEDDLKGFQQLETLFLQASVTIWHILIRERVRKKESANTLLKKQRNDNVFFKNSQWSYGNYYLLASTIY